MYLPRGRVVDDDVVVTVDHDDDDGWSFRITDACGRLAKRLVEREKKLIVVASHDAHCDDIITVSLLYLAGWNHFCA